MRDPLFLVLQSLPGMVYAAPSILQHCGDAFYNVDQYTCYGGSFLCPITNGHATLRCGEACYLTTQYTCYDNDFLCPFEDGQTTLRCGDACYLPEMYSCANNALVYSPSGVVGSGSTTSSISETSTPTSSSSPSPSSVAMATCSDGGTTFHLSDPPYEDYFYSDCHSASQVVVTSPLASSNLSLIAPRLLIAWPAGNSGTLAYFAPTNGKNGTLGLALQNYTSNSPGVAPETLKPIYVQSDDTPLSGNPSVGVSGLLSINASAELVVSILGSVRTMRDFTEGPSILQPEIQDAIKLSCDNEGVSTCTLSRLWLDNVTTTTLSFTPFPSGTSGDQSSNAKVSLNSNKTFTFTPGVYAFHASFDYPQLTPLNASRVLNPSSQDLIDTSPQQTASLAFLSYSTKLLAGGWRFLTYFGRDSMISLLLLQPVLSTGPSGAVEAVIGAVLERLNNTSGQVCHEETIGDYATWQNIQARRYGDTNASCAYTMIDTDLYLPIVIQNYFVDTQVGRDRRATFFAQKATLPFGNEGLDYASLALSNARHIMSIAAVFAAPGNQTIENLHHLLDGQTVGQWRDSTYGTGAGRYPFDVNTALMPAALRAIANLAAADFFPDEATWNTTAASYAQIWEDSTLDFFTINVPQADAKSLVSSYVSNSGLNIPNNTANITSDVNFYALSLDGNNNQSQIRVLHSDTAFRLYLVNSTNDAQLTALLNSVANSILQEYPVGLLTDAGLLVANPAYGGDPVYAANWTRADYHGTVIWGWPMAMMAAGLERQLERCDVASTVPAFCKDATVYDRVLVAYNKLWDVIEANTASLSEEVWAWDYADGRFDVVPYGEFSPTESDVVQLWSLTYLAIVRNPALAMKSAD